MRARITRELIERGGVRIVAVEADWPDARQIDRFVRGAAPDPHPERAFTRFPTWMWANAQVLEFARWLRAFNANRAARDRAGFYGLDFYSLYTSIRAVLAYLDDVDPEAAAVARLRYGCLEPWQDDPSAYGAAALRGRFDGCADQVVGMLQSLLEQRPERLERAIGVIYRPETERASHYFYACLPKQFDEWIWFDETRAVDALPVEADPGKLPETFPFGL